MVDRGYGSRYTRLTWAGLGSGLATAASDMVQERKRKRYDEEVNHPFLLFPSFASQGGQHLTFTFGALFFIVPPPQTYVFS